MSDLANYQRDFVAALDGGRSAPPLIAVYRNTAIKGAVDALADNYPTVAQILGEEAFAALAATFVDQCPPDSPVLAAYGAGFADWLESHEFGRALPYLSGVAQIDRFQTESHLAADAQPLAPPMVASLSADQWSASRAVLHPATRFGWFTLPAPSIWLAHLEPSMEEIAPAWVAEGVLVTRQDGAVTVQRIGAAQHRILFGLRIGETIGQAASVTANLYPNANITGAFRDILASGALSALKTKGH
jgi:hypothetical protein